MTDENGLTKFAETRGWLSNFLKRYNLTSGRRMINGQSVPQDLKDEIHNFVAFNK